MIRRQTLRMISVSSLSLALLLGGALFYMKYRVGEVHDRLMCVNKAIVETTDALHLLDAEWGYLNQPERLKKLNEKHGKLVPANVMQLASIDDFFDRRKSKARTMLASTHLQKEKKRQ